MMDYTLRPLSLSQVLDRTFSLYRKNFILFAGIAVLPPACLLVGQLLFVTLGLSTIGRQADSAVMVGAGIALVGIVLVLAVLWLVGYAFTSGASVFAVWCVHLGYATTIRESFAFIKGAFWRILGIEFLTGLAGGVVGGIGVVAVFTVIGVSSSIGGGVGARVGEVSLAVLLGGATLAGVFFIYAKFSLAIAACVVERLGVIASLQRSFRLTEGTVWRIILIFVLAFVLSIALSAALSLVPYVIGMVVFASRKGDGLVIPLLAVKYVGDFIASTIAYPIATVAGSLIYFDQRVRKEAFDLQFMMESLGQQAPLPPNPAPPLIG